MPNNLSGNAVEAMTASESATVFLTLLTINVDDKPMLYLVNDKQAIISKTQEYTPCAFSALLPDQSDGGSKTCKLQIDNTDVTIYKTIKRAIAHKITVDVSVIISTTPDAIEQGPMHFVLRNITADKNTITGELYDFYMHDRKFTALTYSPDAFPGLHY